MWKYIQTDELYHNVWEYNNPDELYHHGILGMRWRHRKAQMKKAKELRKMKRDAKNAEFQREINSDARTFGTNYVRRSANARSIIGAGQLLWAGQRFKQAKNYNFGVNGKGAMYLNAAINTGLAARGLSNIITARKARKALNEYEYNKLKSLKKKKI